MKSLLAVVLGPVLECIAQTDSLPAGEAHVGPRAVHLSGESPQLIGQNETYDTSGNMTSDPFASGNALVYDAENRLVAVGADITCKYDGDGNRILKIVGTTKTANFHSAVVTSTLLSASGHVLHEMEDSGAGYAVAVTYAVLNGEHIASNKAGAGRIHLTWSPYLQMMSE